jgi:competence protein ComEC
MTASKIFLYFCLSFILGIFLSSFFKISLPVLLVFLILGIILLSVLWKYKTLVVIGFCILFLVAGIWRHQLALSKIENNKLRKFNDLDQKISLIGVVSAEPDIREKSQKLIIQPKEIQHHGLVSGTKQDKILVTTRRYPEYQYGDKLKITGELKTPSEDIEGFNYKDYLKKDGIYSVMGFPKIELLKRENYTGPTSAIYARISSFKNKLRESIYQNLSPPQSSILAAMILGDKRQLSDELKQKLNVTGVRHITAVSGLHVAVLSSILMTLLIGLGLWRQQAFYFAIILITLFIIVTGLQPSAIRAGIMGGLFLLAQYLGRQNTSSRTIVLAAALMLFLNPLLLKLDVGFQLSFLAMLGIIYLLPIFQDWFRKIPNDFQLRSILAMTLSAQVFTLPILIYNFGYISFVALVTNILIVPGLYWIMLFGFLFVFSGVIWQPLGWLFSLPVWFLLTYLIKIVDFASKLPFAFKTLEISWLWLVISYLILGLITWRLQESQKSKFLKY